MLNSNAFRISGALIISLVIHGLFMSLDPFSGRGKVVGKVRKKVVISLSARKAVAPEMPARAVLPVSPVIPAPAAVRVPQVVKEKALPEIEPVPVIVQEIPRPVTPSPPVISESQSEGGEQRVVAPSQEVAGVLPSDSSEQEDDAYTLIARPLYRQNPLPEYPALARRRHLQGNVILEVLVNKKGRVEELFVKESSGYDVLDWAALEAVRDWLFEPGRKGLEVVSMKVLVPVRFSMR